MQQDCAQVIALFLLWSPLTHSSSHPMEQPCSCFLSSGENVFPYIHKNFPTFQPHQLPLILLLCTSNSLFSLSSFRQMQKAMRFLLALIQKEQTPLCFLPMLVASARPAPTCQFLHREVTDWTQCFRCSLKRAKKREITISLASLIAQSRVQLAFFFCVDAMLIPA